MEISFENKIKIIHMGSVGPNLLSLKRQKDIIEELNYDTCKSVIFLGNSKIFCAGLNLKDLINADKEGVSEIFSSFGELLATIRGFPGPVISIVSGHSIAGGCLLAMACDYRYGMLGFHRMGLNEMALSLDLPNSIISIISNTVNPSSLFEVSTQCRLYSPLQAYNKGLINELILIPFVGKNLATKIALKKAIKLAEFYIEAGDPFCRLKKSLIHGFDFDHETLVENWFSDKTQKKVKDALKNITNK